MLKCVIQHSEFDKENSLLSSLDHYTITKECGFIDEYKNSFSLQIYNAYELKEILSRNGFEVVNQYDIEGNMFLKDKSINILTIAKKKI